MKPRDNEILLIYNSEKQQDRKTKGYADSLKNHALNERDITRNNLTETQLAEIAMDMHIEISELMDKNSELYMSQLKDKSFSDEELTKLMVKNPDLIKTPIAYMGSKVFFVGSSYDFVNEDFDIEGVKSSKGNKFEK
ncbi:MAG: ArsC/Spx/MgsR family protein [Fulvivirga sp.]